MSVIDGDGLLYFYEKLKTTFVAQVQGKALSEQDFTTTYKTKLDGLQNYTLPQATTDSLGGIKVGNNLTIKDGVLNAVQGVYTLPAATTTVLGGIKVGANLTMDGTVLNAVDTVYDPVTTTTNGLMSNTDKIKLDSLQNYTLPVATANVVGGIKVGTNLSIADGVLSATNTTYGPATQTVSGLLSSVDKTKLDSLQNYVLPVATANTLGGVRIGENLTMNGDVLNAVDTTYAAATTTTDGLLSSIDKTKLDKVDITAQPNVIEKVQIDGVDLAITDKAVSIPLSNYAVKGTTLANYGITNAYTKDEVNGLLTSVLKPGGNLAFADLPVLGSSSLGYVYNVTDAFTTTASFLEGAGHDYPANSNVTIVLREGAYFYDVMSGFVDLSGYIKTTDIITNTEIDAIIAS